MEVDVKRTLLHLRSLLLSHRRITTNVLRFRHFTRCKRSMFTKVLLKSESNWTFCPLFTTVLSVWLHLCVSTLVVENYGISLYLTLWEYMYLSIQKRWCESIVSKCLIKVYVTFRSWKILLVHEFLLSWKWNLINIV